MRGSHNSDGLARVNGSERQHNLFHGAEGAEVGCILAAEGFFTNWGPGLLVISHLERELDGGTEADVDRTC